MFYYVFMVTQLGDRLDPIGRRKRTTRSGDITIV